MENISLYRWTKIHNINYGAAQRLQKQGLLPEHLTEDTPIPISRDTIRCVICDKQVEQITHTHLKIHKLTLAEYKNAYPTALIVTSTVSDKISTAASKIIKNAEWCENISKSKKGKTPKNHPRYVKGVHRASNETKQKMSESHIGKKHSEETKAKIGIGNKGKIISPENLEKARQGSIAWHLDNPTRGPMSEFQKDLLSKIAISREASYSIEKKARIAEDRAIKIRGLKRTDEQKETYRQARIKFMSENPQKTKDTAGERSIKAWLEENEIDYVQQYVISGHPHLYDFFLPAYDTIIEFDGSHHWHAYWFNILGKSQEERDAMLDGQYEKDAINNFIAGQAGYRIVRIRGHADTNDSVYGSLEDQLSIQEFSLR